ncbi:transmembrane protein, putative, partial [Medicago truncatula]
FVVIPVSLLLSFLLYWIVGFHLEIILRMRLRSNVKVIPLGWSGELLFHLCHYVLLETFVGS